ncbi:hypothetical protein BH09PAT3_BH09PAT3_5810 [soil metagenome]
MSSSTAPKPKAPTSPDVARSLQIQHAINEFNAPLLPFEVVVLDSRLSGFEQDQTKLSELLAEAMQQSSETWHDNAPAEAVMNDSKNLSKRAQETLHVMRHHEIIGYPNDEAKVTLGSVVGIQFKGDPDTEHYLLTGNVREIPGAVAERLPEGTNAVTLASPLGESLYGSDLGDDVAYRVGERTMHVTVATIQQMGKLLTEKSAE